MSSSTHKQLFNFRFLYEEDNGDDEEDDDNEKDEEEDESVGVVDLILARTVTRSCGNTIVGDLFFRLF